MKVTKESVKFIRKSNLSYTKIQKEVKKNFGIVISKSLLSYYKRTKDRLKIIDFKNASIEEIYWLNGIFLADGCKYKNRNYLYTIKFALDNEKDQKIVKKLCYILKKLGSKYSFSYQKNSIIIKTYSKSLFDRLPNKERLFIPKNELAFLSGLIDGDGCKKGNAAVLVQYKNCQTMNYLSKFFKLTKKSFPVLTNFGLSRRRQYYINKRTCDLIRKGNLSIKLKTLLTNQI